LPLFGGGVLKKGLFAQLKAGMVGPLARLPFRGKPPKIESPIIKVNQGQHAE